MSIRFYTARDYDRIPQDQRKIAEDYLLGKEFDSLRVALDQVHQQHTLEWYGFSIGEVKVTPENIPFTLSQVPISVKFSLDTQTFRVGEVVGLIARFI